MDTRSSRGISRRSLLALAAWIALAIFLTRSALVFAIDHVAHGIERSGSWWRLAEVMPELFGVSLVGGLAIAGLLIASAGRSRAARLLATLAAAALLVGLASGYGLDLRSRVPGTATATGRYAWAGLVALGLVAAALSAVAAARLRTVGGAVTLRRVTAVPFALALLAFAVVRFGLVGEPPSMRIRVVERALLEGDPTWEVIERRSGSEPFVGALVPVVDWRVGGGERPALIVPPDGAVQFRLDERVGPVILRAAAGLDRVVLGALSKELPRVAVRFVVEVNDAVEFDRTLAIEHGMQPSDNRWRAIGGADGLMVGPGDEVTLRTRLEAPVDPSEELLDRLVAGFSDLRLERELPRERTPSSPDAPNLMLLLQDTQRRDRLGCYGYERPVSPHLDRLAASGLVFDEAYATSSWTWPSTASVLTGRLPHDHGVLDGSSCNLANGLDTLAEALQRAGMTTAALSGSPLIVPGKSFDQGFETFYHGGSSFQRSELCLPRALDWIRRHAGTRFFLYLHLVDTHEPHDPLARYRDRFVGERPHDLPEDSFRYYTNALRARSEARVGGTAPDGSVVPLAHREWLSDLYDACVATGDHWVGEVVGVLDELGLTDRTVLAFTSDHGEEFFDHGMLEHGHSLYGELVRVPLILAGPGVPSGVRDATPISNRHLAPTLAALAGVRIEGLEGARNLLAPDGRETEPVFFTTELGWWDHWYRTTIHGVRAGDQVLHLAPDAGAAGAGEPTPGGERRLYPLVGPGALEGTALQDPQRADELEALLRSTLRELDEGRARYAIPAGDATRQMLEGIGYVEPGDDL